MDQADSTAHTSDFVATPDGALIPVARPVSLIPDPPAPPPLPIYLSRWTRRQCFFDVVLILILLLASEFLVGFAFSIATDLPDPEVPAVDGIRREMLLPVLAIRSTLCIAIIFAILRWRGQTARSIGLQASSDVVDLVINVVIGIGCTMTAYAWLLIWLFASSIIWPTWFDEMGKNKEQLVNLIPAMHPLWFIPLNLMVATYEELLLRGFLMTRLRRTFGGWTPAVIVSALLFTVAHLGDQALAAMPIIAGLAVIFSIATIWRKSLVPAIVGHFLFNLSQMLGIYLNSPEWRQ